MERNIGVLVRAVGMVLQSEVRDEVRCEGRYFA
jgi:hypothetical protein